MNRRHKIICGLLFIVIKMLGKDLPDDVKKELSCAFVSISVLQVEE